MPVAAAKPSAIASKSPCSRQQAVAAAISQAATAGNPAVDPLHLPHPLIDQEGGAIGPPLEAVGADIGRVHDPVDAVARALPAAQGPTSRLRRGRALPSRRCSAPRTWPRRWVTTMAPPSPPWNQPRQNNRLSPTMRGGSRSVTSSIAATTQEWARPLTRRQCSRSAEVDVSSGQGPPAVLALEGASNKRPDRSRRTLGPSRSCPFPWRTTIDERSVPRDGSHLVCLSCGTVREGAVATADPFVGNLWARHGFVSDMKHTVIQGWPRSAFGTGNPVSTAQATHLRIQRTT